jgi:hypothetical protein
MGRSGSSAFSFRHNRRFSSCTARAQFLPPGCKLTYNDGIFVHVLDYIVNPGQAAPEKRAGESSGQIQAGN